MSAYGKYANKRIFMEDLDDHLNEYIENRMRELYLKRNPPPPPPKIKLDLNSRSTFEIRSQHETVLKVVGATIEDVVALKLYTHINQIKSLVFVTMISIFLTIYVNKFAILIAISYCMTTINDMRFLFAYVQKSKETYKRIAKEESKKVVESIMNS